MTEAHPGILDRERAKAEAGPTIEKVCPLLKEVINYATHAYMKCVRDKKLTEEVQVILFIYRSIVEMIDAAEVSFANAVSSPAELQLRTCFEHLLYIKYICEEDSSRRAKAYLFFNLKGRVKFLRKMSPDTSSGIEFGNLMEKDIYGKNNPVLNHPKTKEFLVFYEDKLSSQEYAEVEAEYRMCKKRTSRKPKWYTLFNSVNLSCSLRELAKHLQMEGMYSLLYSLWSETTHGEDFWKASKHLRDCSRLAINGYYAVWLGTQATRQVVMSLSPEDYAACTDWYVRKIYPRFEALVS